MVSTRPLVALLVAVTAAAAWAGPARPAQAAPPAGPATIVAMGDSVASGEAAGAYEPGTDRPGNFCHRSTRAEIQVAPIANIVRRVNLACSGATTANVALAGQSQYGEAPQAQRLASVARTGRVKLIMLTVGANDVGFTDLVLDCIRAYFLLAPRCQDVWGPRIPQRLAAAAPRIRSDLADIRAVMRAAGYADNDYHLILQSYSSPVTEDNRYVFTRALEGCPHRLDDAKWTRDSVVPQFSQTMGLVAAQAGARFLDLGPALRAHEVCARGITHAQEWVKGIQIDVAQILNGLGGHLVQQSLHPNARGHAQLGRCLAGFAAMTGPAARCVLQPDGTLAPVPVTLTALSAYRPPPTVPRIAEPPLVRDPAKARKLEAELHRGG
jgi:lysophospholipase L1-like esterase